MSVEHFYRNITKFVIEFLLPDFLKWNLQQLIIRYTVITILLSNETLNLSSINLLM